MSEPEAPVKDPPRGARESSPTDTRAGAEKWSRNGTRTRIGPFEVRELLGEAALGRVYLATDPAGREVALAVPRANKLSPEFAREARAGATRYRPHVSPEYEIGTAADASFIVFRFIDPPEPSARTVAFPCTFCGRRIGVPAALLGRQVRCPRCKQVILAPVVRSAEPPEPSARTVAFPCTFCGRRIGVPAALLGRQVRCPRCKQVILAPVGAGSLELPPFWAPREEGADRVPGEPAGPSAGADRAATVRAPVEQPGPSALRQEEPAPQAPADLAPEIPATEPAEPHAPTDPPVEPVVLIEPSAPELSEAPATEPTAPRSEPLPPPEISAPEPMATALPESPATELAEQAPTEPLPLPEAPATEPASWPVVRAESPPLPLSELPATEPAVQAPAADTPVEPVVLPELSAPELTEIPTTEPTEPQALTATVPTAPAPTEALPPAIPATEPTEPQAPAEPVPEPTAEPVARTEPPPAPKVPESRPTKPVLGLLGSLSISSTSILFPLSDDAFTAGKAAREKPEPAPAPPSGTDPTAGPSEITPVAPSSAPPEIPVPEPPVESGEVSPAASSNSSNAPEPDDTATKTEPDVAPAPTTPTNPTEGASGSPDKRAEPDAPAATAHPPAPAPKGLLLTSMTLTQPPVLLAKGLTASTSGPRLAPPPASGPPARPTNPDLEYLDTIGYTSVPVSESEAGRTPTGAPAEQRRAPTSGPDARTTGTRRASSSAAEPHARPTNTDATPGPTIVRVVQPEASLPDILRRLTGDSNETAAKNPGRAAATEPEQRPGAKSTKSAKERPVPRPPTGRSRRWRPVLVALLMLGSALAGLVLFALTRGE